jgi:hypothetical protein
MRKNGLFGVLALETCIAQVFNFQIDVLPSNANLDPLPRMFGAATSPQA